MFGADTFLQTEVESTVRHGTVAGASPDSWDRTTKELGLAFVGGHSCLLTTGGLIGVGPFPPASV